MPLIGNKNVNITSYFQPQKKKTQIGPKQCNAQVRCKGKGLQLTCHAATLSEL